MDVVPSASNVVSDQEAVEKVVGSFLAAFTSGPDSSARLDSLRQLFLPEAVIVRTCGAQPTVTGVDGFIAPRRELLASGILVDFREWAMTGRTEVFGDIAHYFGSYGKSWVQDEQPVEGRGMKSIQLVRTSGRWRISAVAWDDEREGLTIDGSA